MLIPSLLLLASAAVPQDVGAEARALVERSGGRAAVTELGRSRGDRPIHLLTLAETEGTPLAERPALLVVAGSHGQHRLGTELALHHAARLLDQDDAATQRLLRECVVYIVPQLNPDGPALGRSGNARALDLDRDGARDEDPHDDLDGDGKIAQMRWRAPDGDHRIDADEPRLMRPAEREDGERGEFRLAVEGLDNDGDDATDEDAAQGIQLHRSFSHDFAEHDRDNGPVALGEPEARALADFVFAHRHLAMAFVYGPDDTLRSTPKTDAGSRRVPLTGILTDDQSLYEQVGALYRDKAGAHGKGKAHDRHDGSVWSWLYCDVGIPAFASDVWRLPPPDPKSDDAKTEAQVRLTAAAAQGAFVPWREVQHPTLGAVEIGGFVQQHDSALMPEDARDAVFAAHHDLLLEVAAWRARCALVDVEVEARGEGIYQLRATVENQGRLAALAAISVKCRRFSTPQLRLELPEGAQLVAGTDRHRLRNLEGLGGRQELQWLVAAPAGTQLTLTLTSDFAGRARQEVTL